MTNSETPPNGDAAPPDANVDIGGGVIIRAPVPSSPDATGVIAVLREALREARGHFIDYAAQHKARGTPDGDMKAAVNYARANDCVAAMNIADRHAPPSPPRILVIEWNNASRRHQHGEVTGHQLRKLGNDLGAALTAAEEQIAELQASVSRAETSGVSREAFDQICHERDATDAKFQGMLKAEHELSDAYIRLRVILGAMQPPATQPLLELWSYVEGRARAIVTELDALKARCDRFDQIVGRPMAFGHKSHIELAGMIRMLGRNDLDHEPIVQAARDRICWLADQLGIYKTALASSQESAELRLACAQSAQERASRLETERDLARAIKDGAYHERNILVAALARLFPSGLRPTEIEGWNPEWHGCVYIDLPSGQISYHFHDREAHLFEGLPPYTKDWDGHDKDAVHQRLAAIRSQAVTIIPCNDCAAPNVCRMGSVCAKTLAAPQEGGPSS